MPQGGYFSFHTLISTTFIKIIYAGGMVAITIIGLAGIIVPFIRFSQYPDTSPDATIIQAVIGMLVLVCGNLLWRILCESFILLFSVHEMIGDILNQMQTVDSQQAPFIFEQLRATEANNEIRHEELLKALNKSRS